MRNRGGGRTRIAGPLPGGASGGQPGQLRPAAAVGSARATAAAGDFTAGGIIPRQNGAGRGARGRLPHRLRIAPAPDMVAEAGRPTPMAGIAAAVTGPKPPRTLTDCRGPASAGIAHRLAMPDNEPGLRLPDDLPAAGEAERARPADQE